MKITAARRKEDILKDIDEYQTSRDTAETQRDLEHRAYYKALNNVTDPIKQAVEEALLPVSTRLQLDVDVSPRLGGVITVKVASDERNVHDTHKALSWTWSVTIIRETGEVVRESGSWSGLQATTAEQLASLRASVEALEILNSMDWDYLLSVQLPDMIDYVKTTMPDYNIGSKLKEELRDAEIAEYIGQDVAIQGNNKYWYIFVSETPKFYSVIPVFKGNTTDKAMLIKKLQDSVNYAPRRINKDKFSRILTSPINTIQF